MPKPLEIAAEYAHLKCVEPKPVMIAMAKLIQICGDKDIQDYDRKDARAFVDQYGKVKTTTIRRRLNSINAVFNWAAYELDLEQRNPFARLIIREEGRDACERQPFSENELRNLYRRSLSFGKLRLILPILGETGCRLSEVLGAVKQDILSVDGYLVLHVRENSCRSLNTQIVTTIVSAPAGVGGTVNTLPLTEDCPWQLIGASELVAQVSMMFI
jgi:integrase